MRGFFLLILLVSLTSCQPLKWAKGVNEHHFARQELSRIKAALVAQEPSFRVPKTLYLTDETGVYRRELESLLDVAKGDQALLLEVAFLMGDGARVVALATDTTQVANGYLLLGNGEEAGRLISLVAEPDPATTALVALQKQDTLACIEALRAVLHSPSKGVGVGVEAARLWSLLEDNATEPQRYLAEKSPSSWERFMYMVALGKAYPTNSKEQAWTSFVQAMKSPTSVALKKATEELVAVGAASWRDHALERLIPLLYKAELWVEIREALRLLPVQRSREMPYRLLLLYSTEIDLLELYERSDEAVQSVVPKREEESGTFWQRWGNVPNEDNWAMEQGNAYAPYRFARQRPTEEQYKAIRQHLSRVFQALFRSSD